MELHRRIAPLAGGCHAAGLPEPLCAAIAAHVGLDGCCAHLAGHHHGHRVVCGHGNPRYGDRWLADSHAAGAPQGECRDVPGGDERRGGGDRVGGVQWGSAPGILVVGAHPKLFETACDVDYVDSHTGQAQHIDLQVRLPVRRDQPSMDDFCAAIKDFYKKELHCGDVVVGHLMDRVHGTQLVTIHAKDLARTSLEFDGVHLQRRAGNPTIHMALEYSSRTGVARTLIKGGEKYNRMLADAFAEHLLGVKIKAQRLKPPPLDLSGLRNKRGQGHLIRLFT